MASSLSVAPVPRVAANIRGAADVAVRVKAPVEVKISVYMGHRTWESTTRADTTAITADTTFYTADFY